MKAIILSAMLGATAFAAAPSIGIVMASGHFTLEGSQIWGNATLFEGAVIQTGAASSELDLRNGAKVQLGADSKARVFSNRLMLESGVGQVTGPFEIDAAGLKIRGADSTTRLRVALEDGIQIESFRGIARVSNRSNLTLAAIPAGRHMAFAPQAGENGTLTRTGCLLYRDNHFILQDDSTQEVVELNGPDLAANLGNRVEVTGTASTAKPAVSIAASVMNVVTVSPRATGGCLVAAAALGARTDLPPNAPAPASTPAPAAAKTGGLSKGAKIGIGVAAAGGGIGAALALAGGKKSTSP